MLAGHVKGKKRSLSSQCLRQLVLMQQEQDDSRRCLLEFEEQGYVRHAVHVQVCTQPIHMNCLTEALGMGLQGNGTIPAVYSERIKLAKHAGMAVMDTA